MANLRVLVVDDDDLVRVQVSDLLARANHVVHHLASPIGVTRAIMQQNIDVVVIDVMMPSLSGDKLAALLRQNPRLSAVAVILMSSRPAEELASLARDVGADMVLNKADLKQSLVRAVELVASRRRKDQPQ